MPDFTCPKCETENEVEWEDMPPRACDDKKHICHSCATELTIGWVAEIEVRSVGGVCADDL